MQAVIRAIEYYLPATVITNEELCGDFPGWTAEKVKSKTGIEARHVAAVNQYASDLAVEAARKLLVSQARGPEEIDFVMLCTQSPDYLLPTTACLVQDRLGIATTCGALDIGLGCSGFVYGLSIAKGLIETGQARRVLLITCETYSKFMAPDDINVRAIFGDAAAAILVEALPADQATDQCPIGPFLFGTDGSGMANLILKRGGVRALERQPFDAGEQTTTEECVLGAPLYMNGPEIFVFAMRVVPSAVRELLARTGMSLKDVDLFVLHQANMFILEQLRKRLDVPKERFAYALRDCANTTSSSIPIALKRALIQGQLGPGGLALLVGFGVGYSWACALIRWPREGA